MGVSQGLRCLGYSRLPLFTFGDAENGIVPWTIRYSGPKSTIKAGSYPSANRWLCPIGNEHHSKRSAVGPRHPLSHCRHSSRLQARTGSLHFGDIGASVERTDGEAGRPTTPLDWTYRHCETHAVQSKRKVSRDMFVGRCHYLEGVISKHIPHPALLTRCWIVGWIVI